MQTHLKGFGLENFRVFKDYTWFDFAPITILTGPNSSGKSSLNKALMLVKESNDYNGMSTDNDQGENLVERSNLNRVSRKIRRKREKKFQGLNFSTDITAQLGSFDRIVNNASGSRNLRFSAPFKLNHFPILGDESDAVVNIYYFGSEGELEVTAKIELCYDGKVLFSIDQDEFCFNPKTALTGFLLNVDRNIDIQTKNGASLRLLNKFTNSSEPKSLSSILREAFILRRPNESEIKEVLDLYISPNEYNFDEVWKTPLAFVEIIEGVDQNGEEFVVDVGENYDEEPLVTILKSKGFTDSQIEFLRFDVFRLDYWLHDGWADILKEIKFQSPIEGKSDRIYRRQEENGVNKLINAFYRQGINNDLSRTNFLKKWSAKFDLLGEITPFIDAKLNIQGLEIGGLPIIEQGLGISQLTVLLLSILTKSSESHTSGLGEKNSGLTLILEEPESNLHPKYQSMLADLIVDAAEKFQIQFIIETHSEYLIRKLQYLTAKKEIKPSDSVIYYFHDPNNVPKDEKQVKKIEILEDGSLSDDFGPGFFDEAANWELELIRLKNSKNRNN